MMVEVAKAQDDEVGDGTTTAVVIAGELLKKAEELLDQNIHPTIIVEGYKKAADEACKILDEIALTTTPDNYDTLVKIGKTALNSKAVAGAKDLFAKIAVDAIKQIVEKRDERLFADVELVGILKKQGKSLLETELVSGIVIDKEVLLSTS